MDKIKKQMILFWCMLLCFSTMVTVIPQKVEAATKIEILNDELLEASEVWIYKGAKKLYWGDYICVMVDKKYYELGFGYLTRNGGATYKSSNPSVVAIDKKTGKITAKKTGTATITTKYKGNNIKAKIRVVETREEIIKNCYDGTQEDISDIDQRTNIFFEQVDTRPKIKASNRYSILSACYSYDSSAYEPEDTIGVEWFNNIYYVYAPEARRACVICEQMKDYVSERNPFRKKNKNAFKIKSISGKGNSRKITIKLKSKVTDEQMFGVKSYIAWDTEIHDSKNYEFPVSIKNTRNGHYYYAIAKIKKGSDTITIDTKKLKLKKGTTYQILDDIGWELLDEIVKKDTFKAS